MYCAQKQYSNTDYKKIVVETSKRDKVLSTEYSHVLERASMENFNFCNMGHFHIRCSSEN